MKKYLLSSFVIIAYIAYTVLDRLNTVNIEQAPASISPTISPTNSPNRGRYKDGEYTGLVVDAFYGNVQVKTIINNGYISDVQFLNYPQDRSNSVVINTQAMPILKQEAIQVQSANIDIVSGATATSKAFIESLQSALSQAALE